MKGERVAGEKGSGWLVVSFRASLYCGLKIRSDMFSKAALYANATHTHTAASGALTYLLHQKSTSCGEGDDAAETDGKNQTGFKGSGLHVHSRLVAI